MSRITAWVVAFAMVVVCSATGHEAFGATSSQAVTTPFAGNGHNVSFDGRLFITRRGPDSPSGGWFATLLRPENITMGADGMPRFDQGAFSPYRLIQPFEAGENALAICEPEPAPYQCDEAGNENAAGPYACYDVRIIDSNAYPEQVNALRVRALKLWVSNPETPNADVHKWEWGPSRQELSRNGGGQLRGIEPTVTADGHMLVWQGHPDNDGKIDVLMYATNSTACGVDGWTGPHNLGQMFTDPNVNGVYPLGGRALRAADGTVYGPNDMVRGAYPWIFPDGEAINFTSVTVPCRSENDPPGCGPRRGGLAVIGYPTNWSLAHIDGAVNPDTNETVRLFFSSPGPDTFSQIPVTPGVDVWPMFGSNTQNYTEVVFDDGLDGNYAGVWHMNEMVDRDGDLDRSRTPDVSGYFNTGQVEGAVFPTTNNSPTGKALVFDGVSSHVRVPHDASLDPVNAITIEMRLRLDADPDCDGGNNYRFLLGKGSIGDGSYSLVLEDGRQLQGRVKVDGEQRALVSSEALPVGEWVDVTFAYVGATGEVTFEFDGAPAGSASYEPGQLSGSDEDLLIGGPGGTRDACPQGDGAFAGAIDEVRISRSDRDPDPDPDPEPDMGTDPGADMGSLSRPDAGSDTDPDTGVNDGADAGTAGSQTNGAPGDEDGSPSADTPALEDGGCACATGASGGAGAAFLFVGLLLFGRRRR
jgi:MYXO-CTERM domain-containing protein